MKESVNKREVLNHLILARNIAKKIAKKELADFTKEGYVFCKYTDSFYKRADKKTVVIMMPIINNFYRPMIVYLEDDNVFVAFEFDREDRVQKIEDQRFLSDFMSEYKISIDIFEGIPRELKFDF